MNWRARILPKRLVIAAASSRPFVRAAAAAGYQVVAADVFGDADTRRHASHIIRLGYADGGFDVADVHQKLLPWLSRDVGFVYGSGFESQPELLDEIAGHCNVLGNTAEMLMLVKDPASFFGLLSSLEIPCPPWSPSLPGSTHGWLAKRVGGSGGTHVVPGVPAEGSGCYWQRQMPGAPYSLLFLADGRRAQAVGFNAQWLAPAPGMPYRYGGAVSQAVLPETVRFALLAAAQRMVAATGLRGLNSLDCMVDDDDFWVLEVNPRLSATFALYDTENAGAALFESHLQACRGLLQWRSPAESARAHLIYYAPFDTAIPQAMNWPSWVADVPDTGVRTVAGEPLCSILAEGADAAAAKTQAETRARELQDLFNQTLGTGNHERS